MTSHSTGLTRALTVTPTLTLSLSLILTLTLSLPLTLPFPPNQVCDFPFERLLCWRGKLGLGLPLVVRRAVLPLLLALGGLTVL